LAYHLQYMQALELLANYPDIKLIVSDVVMPNMNGGELAEKVHQQYPHIPIQLVSGYADLVNQKIHHSTLLTNLLHKPYRHDDLLKRIRQLLDN